MPRKINFTAVPVEARVSSCSGRASFKLNTGQWWHVTEKDWQYLGRQLFGGILVKSPDPVAALDKLKPVLLFSEEWVQDEGRVYSRIRLEHVEE